MIGAADAVLGWDVGGANIKVARVEENGREQQPIAVEHPFALWREPDQLPRVLVSLADRVGPAAVMAITMTAELADCFATKRDGVAFVLRAFETAFPSAALWAYGVDGQFRSPLDARERPHGIAAANWMASATLVARSHPNALLVDVGTTTTDIIPIRDGRVAASGRSDLERLQLGELIYTGCLRTPVCAIVQSVPFRGGWCRVAAEHFAVAADVHRWLRHFGDNDYTCDTPDGRGRSRAEAGARLARVVCADAEAVAEGDISAIADHVARVQMGHIRHGLRQVLRRVASPRSQVITAGRGAFLARAAAEGIGLGTNDLTGEFGADAARSIPAVAVAVLLSELRHAGVA